MFEYIDRSELLKRLKVTPLLELGVPLHVKEGVLDLVSKQPAADVATVRRGRWKFRRGWYDLEWECSECSETQTYKHTGFCPNCGAKMGGGTHR